MFSVVRKRSLGMITYDCLRKPLFKFHKSLVCNCAVITRAQVTDSSS